MEKILVIGGGLSGSLMSVFLAKRGFEVHLFERRPDMRKNKISAGRSINLALSVRGLTALEKLGLDKEILEDGIPMYGRMMHSVNGELAYQPYGKDDQAIYSVSRGRLNIQLLELADELPNIHLYFNHRCLDIDWQTGTATFEDENKEVKSYTGTRILGSDVAFAATRSRMQIGDRFDYSQSYLEHGYKELAIPAGENGQFLIEKNALHIWPRGSYMMIALPNPAGDFTCTLFYPFEGENSFDKLKTKEDVQAFFERDFKDAMEIMPTLAEDFFNNPTSSLVTVRCFPWIKSDKLALIGDAAHAIVPFYGQGMNCSFEDCLVLDQCIEKHYPNWENVFSEYQKLRKPNADAIADLAVQNFIEMRDLVGDADFLEKKHIEHDLAELYPKHYKSQYELVSFSTVPYSVAKAQGQKNDAIINKIRKEKIDIKNSEIMIPLLKEMESFIEQ